MTKVWFDVISKNGTVCTMGFTFRQACLFGWVGRNQEEVRAHAAELAAHGIRGPKNIPEYFLMTSDVITHSPEIVVVGDRTCGEVEIFFFRKNGQIYVGVGSEHTDRELEGYNMIKSKAICQKPMSKEVWLYEDIKDHWDEIQLTSWQINEQGERILYQDEPLGTILPLEDLLERAEKLYPNLDDVIIWSGTISALNGLVYGSTFSGEMNDKVLGRKLTFTYDIKAVPADFEY